MTPAIYLRQGNDYLEMSETPYDEEKVLQELIERHPKMLAGDDASHGALVLVTREAGVADEEEAPSRWSLDHLYVDAEGVPTLVEVKRSSDTRSRRLVVAQMLDYAANARASFSAERMAQWLDESAQERGTTAAEILKKAFAEEDPDGFWQTVDTNLKAEKFRLVFVADSIAPELRTIIEFLNRQMNATEVLAIEVKQYEDEDGTQKTIVPRVVGDTAQAREAKRPRMDKEPLNREGLVQRLTEQSQAAADAAAAILDWVDGEVRVYAYYTSTAAKVKTGWGDSLISIWADPRWITTAPLSLGVKWLLEHGDPWDDQEIDKLLRSFADIGVEFEGEPRWPAAPLDALADPDRRRRFLEILEGVLDTLRPPPSDAER